MVRFVEELREKQVTVVFQKGYLASLVLTAKETAMGVENK